MKELVQDPNWKPTKRLWFNKFQYAILLGPFRPPNTISIDYPYRSRSKWVFNKDEDTYEVLTTVYVDSIDLLKGLINLYPYTEVYTPMNDQHEEILQDKRKQIRDKLWHGKYRYKIDLWPTRRPFQQYNRTESEIEKQEIIEVLLELFKYDSHVRRANWNWGDLPYIYTNNEKSLMLLKLRYSDTLTITITEAVTFDEIIQMA